jgi:hypothetical protein
MEEKGQGGFIRWVRLMTEVKLLAGGLNPPVSAFYIFYIDDSMVYGGF